MESVNPLLPALRPSTPGLLRRTGGMFDAVRGIQQESKYFWFEKGVAYKDAEQWEDAVFCFRKISNEQQDWQTHLLQGYCNCRAHNFTESLISLRKFALEFIDKADFVSQAREMFPYQRKMYPRQCEELLIYELFVTETKSYNNGSRNDDYYIEYDYISNVKPHVEQDRLLISLLLMMDNSSRYSGSALLLKTLEGINHEDFKFEKARLLLWSQEYIIENECSDGDDVGCWIVREWAEAAFYEKGPDLIMKYKVLLALRGSNKAVEKRIANLVNHVNYFQFV